MSHIDLALDYADGVINGDIPACKYVRWACQRQIDDLQNPPSGYYFDVDLAEHICKFSELMPHIKGEWAASRQKITLEPWQAFILTTVFGWRNDQKYRRFKIAYVEVPRKNAKSTICSCVGLYCLAADGEPGAEVYSAATNRDQAKIVWRDSKTMAERSPGIKTRFGVETSAHSIFIEENASFFKPLARDMGGNLDGLNIHCGIIDELHGHKTRHVWDVVETGTGSRTSPLIFAITTAGFNKAGICYEQRADAIRVLDPHNEIKDEELFGIIYTIDDEDDWKEESSWIKANPNWGVSVKPDDIRRKARKAMRTPSAQNNFLTKHLCVWTNAGTGWMNMVDWDRAGNSDLDERDFEEDELYLGADLASKIDIASTARLYRRDDKFYLFTSHYLNEDQIFESENSQYQGWSISGHLIETPGNTTDFQAIEDDITQSATQPGFKEIAFDPDQARYLMQNLIKKNLNVVEVPQNTKNLSEPMKMLESLILERRLEHNNNPVMNWMVSNVICHTNAKEQIYPRKEFPQNKIDGVIAAIIALNRALVDASKPPSVYDMENRGINFI